MKINEPVDREFMLKINVYGISRGGGIKMMLLHTEENIDSDTNIFLNYEDNIIKGDIIQEKVMKAIFEDFGIEKIREIDFVESPIEEDILDDTSDEIFKYEIDVIGEKEDYDQSTIGDLFVSWIDEPADESL